MDPPYYTREELYGLQMGLRQLQLVQNNHAERLARIEKRHAEDAALKSVWNSPFSGGAFSGGGGATTTASSSQHHSRRPSCPSSVVVAPPVTEYGSGPVKLPHDDMFDDLDEHGEHLLGSLHLGHTDEEPARRGGAASRANSVRFDESALQSSSWNSRPDAVGQPRSSAPPMMMMMMERSLSYKSDGRHSSAAMSVHSVASGRASSLGIDTGEDEGSPADYIEPPPGFLVLGSVPAIIRCWLTTDFASETLLYAGVCSGAQASTVEHSLLGELGLAGAVQRGADGVLRARLPVYLTEAIAKPATTARTTIPHIMVDLEVVGGLGSLEAESAGRSVRRSIRVFLGSDALRAHSADVLFSQNQMTIFSSDRAKFAVPFARPEDEAVYRLIRTGSAVEKRLNANAVPFVAADAKTGNKSHEKTSNENQGLGLGSNNDDEFSYKDRTKDRTHGDYGEKASRPGELLHARHERAVEWLGQDESHSLETEPAPTPRSVGDASTAPSAVSSEGRRESTSGTTTSGIWGSWRNANPNGGGDPRDPISGYQPAGRSRNMKVLRPQKSATGVSAKTGAAYEPPPAMRGSSERRRSQASVGDRPKRDERDDKRNPNNNVNTGTANNAINSGNANNTASTTNMHSNSSAADAKNTVKEKQPSARRESRRSISVAGHELEGIQKCSPPVPTPPRSANPVGVASAFSWMNGMGE